MSKRRRRASSSVSHLKKSPVKIFGGSKAIGGKKSATSIKA